MQNILEHFSPVYSDSLNCLKFLAKDIDTEQYLRELAQNSDRVVQIQNLHYLLLLIQNQLVEMSEHLDIQLNEWMSGGRE